MQITTQPAETSFGSVLLNLLPRALIVGLFVWTGRSARRQLAGMGSLGGIGRSRAKVFDAERPDTAFDDVAGYEGVKREVTEVVDFLKNPGRYRRAGAVGPKGVLMRPTTWDAVPAPVVGGSTGAGTTASAAGAPGSSRRRRACRLTAASRRVAVQHAGAVGSRSVGTASPAPCSVGDRAVSEGSWPLASGSGHW